MNHYLHRPSDYQPKDTYSPALGKAILHVLSRHIGLEEAIGRQQLIKQPEIKACGVGERVVRDTIRLLRRDGHLICSAPGAEGGYYLPSSWEEFDVFAAAEYQAKISDMSVTLAAMKKAARQRWGEARQPSLI